MKNICKLYDEHKMHKTVKSSLRMELTILQTEVCSRAMHFYIVRLVAYRT